jgi:hypothetical protein
MLDYFLLQNPLRMYPYIRRSPHYYSLVIFNDVTFTVFAAAYVVLLIQKEASKHITIFAKNNTLFFTKFPPLKATSHILVKM